MENKKIILGGISIGLGVLFIVLCVMIIPIIKQHIQVQRIKNQIEQVQLQIELNKEQRNSCKENMDTWHSENEDNRKILNNLMLEYNSMVAIYPTMSDIGTATTSRGEGGFTTASDDNRVSPITGTVDTTEMISDT